MISRGRGQLANLGSLHTKRVGNGQDTPTVGLDNHSFDPQGKFKELQGYWIIGGDLEGD